MDKSSFFPDGSLIDSWFYFYDNDHGAQSSPKYLVTDFGIKADGKIYTKEFQSLIDLCHNNGGGVIEIPSGRFYTGALFFKQNVNLYIHEGGILTGSDDICDYPVLKTRIEGETADYFSALINADGIDGFSIYGKGCIDGNGLKSWKAFWLRRQWNPECTNKDEQRPRLIYISNCKNVFIKGITFKNSHFWTCHLYKSSFVKIIDSCFYSPASPVKAPSTDAVDIDACSDVLIHHCYMEVNDDAVALKGGKGIDADRDDNNGINERIIIEDCEYGFCHGCLTLGSEAVHCKNVILRNITVKEGFNLLWLKMRCDTPQVYEHIAVDNVKGNVDNFINITPWKQFFNLKGHKVMPHSLCENISMSNCDVNCKVFYNVKLSKKQYTLKGLSFKSLKITCEESSFSRRGVEGFSLYDVFVNGKKKRNCN